MGKGKWLLIFLGVLFTLSFAAVLDCPLGSVLRGESCIQCASLKNTNMIIGDGHEPNVCLCLENYKWSKDTAECRRVCDQTSFQRSTYPTMYLEDGQEGQELTAASRLLASSCDWANGFIFKNRQCISCRLIQHSTGVAANNTACVCKGKFKWWAYYQVCSCQVEWTQMLYLNNGVCTACSLINDKNIQRSCKNCYGDSFGLGLEGCINCTTIPHATGASMDYYPGICTCQTGYYFNQRLSQCICDIYKGYLLTDKGCVSCQSLGYVSNCFNCKMEYLYNGYYCQNGSTFPNYDITQQACDVGYDFKQDPITNLTVSCSCSIRYGSFLNGQVCSSCTGVNGTGLTVQGCQDCSQSEGYFFDGVKCIYCPGVLSSTGVATMDGCGCLASHFWNTLTGTCQCDWVKGYTFYKGRCLNCGNIPKTILPANVVGSCNCAPGYKWDSVKLICACSLSQGSFVSSVAGCVNCFMRGSTGKVINKNSCLCLHGFAWDAAQLACVCNSKRNFYQFPNDGICRDCAQIANSNGMVSARGCGCLKGYTWIAETNSCGCPLGYVSMLSTCLKCYLALRQLKGKTINGCNLCSNSEGFFLSNGVCLACQMQGYTTGVATSSGCTCQHAPYLFWDSIRNSCACDFYNEFYVTKVVDGRLSCSFCNNFDCYFCGYELYSKDIFTPIGNDYGICTSCTGQENGGCNCYPGYFWSELTYPFQCACSWRTGGYLSGSNCFNCSTLPSTGNQTAFGCEKCDPLQGFLYISFNDSCVLCSMVTNSDGVATRNGCGCSAGMWSTDQLACVPIACQIEYCSNCNSTNFCSQCLSGYILNRQGSQCLFNCSIPNCTFCSSMTTCSSCRYGRVPGSNGTQCIFNCPVVNCAVCNSVRICSSCVTGYFLSNNICRFNCSIPRCSVCSSTTTCSSCALGLFLNDNNTLCLYNCSIPFCGLCSSATRCSSCVVGHILSNNACSFNCSISNCANCNSTSTCSACKAGYTLSQNSTQCILLKVGSQMLASQSSSDTNTNLPLIVGVSVAGLTFVVLVVTIVFLVMRKRAKLENDLKTEHTDKVVVISPSGKDTAINDPEMLPNPNASETNDRCVTEGRLQEAQAYCNAKVQL